MAIGASNVNATLAIKHLRVHHNEALRIGSANGKIIESEVFANSSNPDSHGFESASSKGVDEYEVARSYIHDEQANGIWCDHRCKNVSNAQMPNGFWAHGNFVENVGPWGIRYGYSSRFTDGDGQDGSVDSSVTALVENNVVHIAGFQPNHSAGALSMHDVQNRTFHDNSLNANDGPGMQFAWSRNRSDRTNLYNSPAEGNSLSGEAIRGCGMTDDDANPGGVLVARRNNAP